MVTGAGERFTFSESQGVKGTEVFIEFDLNEDAVLAALLIDSKDFSGDRGHMCHFLRQTSAEMGPVFKASGTERHQGKRELETFAPVAH